MSVFSEVLGVIENYLSLLRKLGDKRWNRDKRWVQRGLARTRFIRVVKVLVLKIGLKFV